MTFTRACLFFRHEFCKFNHILNHKPTTMNRPFSRILLAVATLFIFSCGNKGKESASSIAQKWCDLNGRVEKAQTDEAKDAAKQMRKKFENEIDQKYKGDEKLMKEINDEIEKCENASEGK